jgi:hypothetical protein
VTDEYQVPDRLLTVLCVCGCSIYAVKGWAHIAEAMGCSMSTAERWSRREHDPLPARKHLGAVYVRRDELLEWLARNSGALARGNSGNMTEGDTKRQGPGKVTTSRPPCKPGST